MAQTVAPGLDDVTIAEFRLLGMLQKFSQNMGNVLGRFMKHQDRHGTYPPAELRELSKLLREVAGELDAHADTLDPPIVIDGCVSSHNAAPVSQVVLDTFVLGDPGKYRYRALANHIRALIQNGTLQHNDRLPSERAFRACTGLALATVRRAIRTLEGEGLVVTLQGRGTHVNCPNRAQES